jgi:hypothetical protein
MLKSIRRNVFCPVCRPPKPTIICVVVFMLFPATSIARIHKVEYDLCKNDYVNKQPPRCIIAGDVIDLTIRNVNQIKYKVIVGTQTYTYKFDLQDTLRNKLPLVFGSDGVERIMVKQAFTTKTIAESSPQRDTMQAFIAGYSRLVAIHNYSLQPLLQNRAFNKDSIKAQAEKGLKDAYGITNVTYNEMVHMIDSLYISTNGIVMALRRDTSVEKAWRQIDSIGILNLNAKAASDWNLYAAIINSETTVGTTISSGNKSDGLNCKISIVSKTDSSDTSSFGFSVKIRRPFQGFFSAGVFVSSVHDSTYGTKDTSYEEHTSVNGKDTVEQIKGKKLVDQTGAALSYGFCAIYHWMYYPVEWFGVGSNLGVTLDVPEVNRTELLTGVSVAFGEMSRIVLSGGVSLSKVSRLADGLVLGKPYQSDLSSVPTVLKNDWGWYGCVTYAFGQEAINK